MRQPSAGSGIRRRRADRAAFTLLEVLVGVVLLAVVASGSAVLISVANSMLATSTSQNNTQAAIDSDISRARKLAEDYTCCVGSPDICTADAAKIATARASGKCIGNANDSTYYFPQQTADIAAFTAACVNGTLTTNLIAAIQQMGNVSGVTRNLAADDSSDPTTHRLRITYSGSNLSNASIIRVVKLVPTAAAWCP